MPINDGTPDACAQETHLPADLARVVESTHLLVSDHGVALARRHAALVALAEVAMSHGRTEQVLADIRDLRSAVSR